MFLGMGGLGMGKRWRWGEREWEERDSHKTLDNQYAV